MTNEPLVGYEAIRNHIDDALAILRYMRSNNQVGKDEDALVMRIEGDLDASARLCEAIIRSTGKRV